MNAHNPGKSRPPASLDANISEQENAGMDSKSVRLMSDSDTFKKSIGKADSRYWQQAGKLLTDSRSRFLFCKIQVHGKRESFPLRTSNKSTAAAKAAKIYGDVVALGWDAAIAKHKPETLRETGKPATVGALIEASCAASTARKHSLEAYSKAFRRVVSEVAGIQDGRKFDAFKGGTKEWRERVDAVPLASLLPADVQGVDTMKPLHTMRKEIGSIIASEHGIFEASRYLRHSDIRITSAIYADKKKTVTPKAFAGLLTSAPNVIEANFIDKAVEASQDDNKNNRHHRL